MVLSQPPRVEIGVAVPILSRVGAWWVLDHRMMYPVLVTRVDRLACSVSY